MKLLWHSNAPWAATGYGVQTKLFYPHLKEKYDLAISAFYGLEAGRLNYDGVTILPGLEASYGDRNIRAHANNFFQGDLHGGLVFTLMDAWVLDPNVWKEMRVACWYPVDHDPLPLLGKRWFKESGSVPIAMSRFGQRVLSAAGYDPLYIPHGIDTSVYKPKSQVESRKLASLPKDAFVVGVVAANKGEPSRKCFPELIRAFEIFRQHHNEAVLYLHTEIVAKGGMGLPAVFEQLGTPEAAVFTTDQARYRFDPLPPSTMAHVYSAFDVLLNPSAGEGFGIPILEAQACGIPAIVSDFSAMPEVCGVGWHVDSYPFWTGQASWQVRPKVEDIVDALERAFAMPRAQRKEMRESARKHAQKYDAKLVAEEHMIPAIEESAERLGLKERAKVLTP